MDSSFKVNIDEKAISIGITSPKWKKLQLAPLICEVQINGEAYRPTGIQTMMDNRGRLILLWRFSDCQILLTQKFTFMHEGKLTMESELKNLLSKPLTFNSVALLKLKEPGKMKFGRKHENALLYEDVGYRAHVRRLSQPSSFGENQRMEEIAGYSQFCWEIYNPLDRIALLIGYTTFERWLGTVKISYSQKIGVTSWIIGFDGGDTVIDPGNNLPLEEVAFLIGKDPWSLLEEFGDLVKEKHHITPLDHSPVSWCSWYPYRHNVMEDDVLENAKVAAQRLKPLGLEYMKVDLGWEKDFLPSSYEENEKFPHGLKWLSEELEKIGFKLGIWIAPFTISEFDSVFKEHPEWLLGSEIEEPASYGTWFWRPQGKIYALDLTHPGAQKYLKENIKMLAEKGVKYFKLDFIGGPCDPRLRKRYNNRMVAGGGVEAVRVGSKIIAETVKSVNPDAVILNCNPYEVCGLGYFDLLYTCNDTGNTGYIPWSTMKENFTSVACHLWKNRRLGIIEPSCLCVGFPGTLEEARVRATVAFLSGGEVDVSDDLTTLPEDRWQILLSTLPPSGKSAKPVDLFEKISIKLLPYSRMCKGVEEAVMEPYEGNGSRVWVMPIEADWDRWLLLGLFLWEPPSTYQSESIEENKIPVFEIEWKHLGLNPRKRYWLYEFWSGQFLGEILLRHEKVSVFPHPGDTRVLLWGSQKDSLKIAFFGPSVKLLAIREVRDHPWVVGTSFHMSCGLELKNVKWSKSGNKLRGELCRPPGQEGFIVIAGVNGKTVKVKVAGKSVQAFPSANGSMKIPIHTQKEETPWIIKID